MANDVNFDLNLSIKGFQQSIDKVDKGLDNFHKDFKKQAKSSSAAWSSFAGNLAANAVSFAAQGISNLVGSMGSLAVESVRLAAIQEDAINDLNVALKGTGTFTEAASQDFQKFASSLQQSSTFGDEAILSMAALGVQMAKLSGQDLKDATEAALNMASALNIDLNTAMTLVAKSATDNGSGLKRYGVVVEKGATQQQTLANAISAVNDKFSGAAAGKIKTYSGAVQQAQNSYGDMLEEIGKVITQSPALTSVIGAASKQFSVLGKFITANSDMVKTFIQDGLLKVIDGFSFLIDSINPVVNSFKFLWNGWLILQNGLTSGMAVVTLAVSELSRGIISSVQAVMSVIPDSLIPDGWKESLESADEALAGLSDGAINQLKVDVKDMDDAFSGMGNSLTNSVSEERLESFREGLTLIKDEVISSGEEITEKEKEQEAIRLKNQQAANLARGKERAKNTNAVKKDISLQEAFFGSYQSFEESTNKQRTDNFKSTLGTIATLSTSGNKTLATIGKASAISTATIDGISAVQKALASAPPPFNFALAGLVGAATTANVAKISGVNFAQGGIVGGSSFTGDNVGINVNSSEMILNRGQQAQLFQQANGGGGNSSEVVGAIQILGDRIANMEIVMQSNDQELARSVSRGVQDGVIIGESR